MPAGNGVYTAARAEGRDGGGVVWRLEGIPSIGGMQQKRSVQGLKSLCDNYRSSTSAAKTVCGKTRKVVIPNEVRNLLLLKTKQIPHLGKNRRGSE